MSEKEKNENNYDDGTYVVKKNKKAGIVALIVCLLIAFLIWCYAKADAMKEESENTEPPTSSAVEDNAGDGAEG